MAKKSTTSKGRKVSRPGRVGFRSTSPKPSNQELILNALSVLAIPATGGLAFALRGLAGRFAPRAIRAAFKVFTSKVKRPFVPDTKGATLSPVSQAKDKVVKVLKNLNNRKADPKTGQARKTLTNTIRSQGKEVGAALKDVGSLAVKPTLAVGAIAGAQQLLKDRSSVPSPDKVSVVRPQSIVPPVDVSTALNQPTVRKGDGPSGIRDFAKKEIIKTVTQDLQPPKEVNLEMAKPTRPAPQVPGFIGGRDQSTRPETQDIQRSTVPFKDRTSLRGGSTNDVRAAILANLRRKRKKQPTPLRNADGTLNQQAIQEAIKRRSANG